MHPGPRLPLITRVSPGRWPALDCLAAAAYSLVAVPFLLNSVRGPAAVVAVPAGLVLFCLPIAVRRRRPIGAFALVLSGLLVVGLIEPRALTLGLVSVPFVLYTVAVTCRPSVAVVALAVSAAGAVATALPDFRHRGGAVLFSLVYVAVWTIGFAVGMHRRHTEDLLRSQAALAEAELEKARRGVAEERMRIARELHDVVAHSMSVITVQAGFGAMVIDDRPHEARAALSAIASTGRETLTELRRLLGVLRVEDPATATGEPELSPSPRLADLDRLVKQTAAAGVKVDVEITGRPRGLPAGVDLSAYRILQEALTNVVKHAGVPRARATLDYRADELLIEVTDKGRGCHGDRPRAGHGLVGMRERVNLYGGSFQAAPLPGHGFKVTARLPLRPDGPPAGACPHEERIT
ncbi:sensor histidine kinase [Microbispora sp. NPDC046933]|uniref:sensor histidine kinase n=1 Tax=Microbispora sp. NPDC046933 TaxID=3155618 RepID=UPI0033DC3D89